ncbi:MAG TPA: cytochrome c-type biogenesis protein CcmH [Acidimicrobiales bacterium]|nr:cytochrome c-type biogenesis protein CcmH [Acidimicrobiales bacterium]
MPEAPAALGPPPAALGPRRRRVWPQVALLLVVAALALAVGSGLGSRSGSAADRTAALEADIRCPACQDVSVADSEDPSAVAVRHQIAAMVAHGRTDAQVEGSLVARYGPTILLRPPTTGASALVWLIPVIAGALAVTGMAVVFWRRARRLGELRSTEP